MNSLRNKLSNRKLMQNGLIHLQSYSSLAPPSNIQIPNRKERGPTDILKALDNTIRRDPTAPHYKYIDDPYLIPLSHLDKRSCALSKESGRKAAMWIRQEHAEFFQHKIADPMIESFAPRVVCTDKTQASEELLLNNIKSANVTDSLQVYNFLEGNVRIETKLALYELLCYANSTQPTDSELTEQRWFYFSHESSWTTNKPWVNCPDKENLFKSLVEEGGDIAAAAYNALICGLSKYKNAVKAYQLYEECEEKKIPINKRTYDYLILSMRYTIFRDDDRLASILQIYKKMVEKNLRPDIKTLNASLSLTSMMKRNRELTFSMFLNEFKRINIKASLASYLYYLQSPSSNNNNTEESLVEVLNILEKEPLEFQDPEDKNFFIHTMRLAYECESLSLGKRLHDLLLKPNNYVFIGDSYKENVYYRYFILLHLNSLNFESFMKIYEALTPNIYTPESSLFQEILEKIKDNDPSIGREMLPFMYSQATIFDFIRNEDVLNKLFDLMTGYCKPPSDSPLTKTFAQNAWDGWNQMQELKSISRRGVTYSASVLERMAVLCLRGDEFDQMLDILSILINGKNTVLGAMTPDFINEIFDACIARGHAEAVLSLIEYAIEFGMEEGITMGIKAYNNLAFSVAQENKLQTLVGKDLKKVKLTNKES